METLDAIKGRRCVRAFKDKEIPEEILYNVLEAAVWAPSSGNLQTTRLLVITDKAKKAKIAKAALGQNFITQAPVVILICSETETVERAYKTRGKNLYSIQNTAVVIQNILLAAYDQGLAGCWVGAFTERSLKREFEIPDEIDIHAIIPIGYAAEKPTPPPRISLADITYFKKWEGEEAGEGLFPLSESAPKIAKKTAKKARKIAGKAKKAAKKARAKLKRK